MDVENHDNMENIHKKEEENLSSEDITEIEIPYALYQYLSSEQCNLEALCRICLSTGNEIMYPLLSTKENSLLAVMLTELTSVQLMEDGLPSNICQLCQTQVIQCYEFKNKCMKSDCLLKSILKNEFIAKEELNNDSMVFKQESQSTNVENNLKPEETEMALDVEYLEDLSDDAKDTLQVLQNTKKRKKRKINAPITDSNNPQDVVLEKKCVETKTYRCSICYKKFSNAKTYRAHVNGKCCGAKSPHPCAQCKESFETEHDLLLHSAVHAEGPVWKCITCHKEYNGAAALRRHVRRHMQGKRHACAAPACGKRFSERSALRRHARVHTGQPPRKPHACPVCDKRYSDSGQLAAHAARHAGLRPCACAACGKAFPSPRLLASHMLVHSDDKPYACRYCDKRFRHESTRNTHHRTHTGERPYICSACGKRFIQNSNLTLHMRTHTGERPYSCSTCGRKFSSGSALKAHERVHSGERAYSCNICGKNFSQLNLKAHMRLHSGERPHACSACPKTFLSASRLRDHCRIHTGEKPFECAICSRKCATKNHLAKHVKTHQPKNGRDPAGMKNVESFLHPNVMYKQYKENTPNELRVDNESKEIILSAVPLEVAHEVPLEVTGELVLQDDSDVNAEYLVVDNSQNNYQSDNISINTDGIKFVNDISDTSQMNLATMNEGGVSFSTSNVEGTTVKLYQLDQSLVQIHSSGGQVTISKITSKMTANF